MRVNDTKVFKEKPKLYTMLNLRRTGWSFTSLGFLYGCDRTSVWAQCEKYGVLPIENEVYTFERIVRKVTEPWQDKKWKVRDGERVCRGVNYQEYLNKEARKHRRLFA